MISPSSAYVDAEYAALPWDRLGHWAQDEGDWVEAERCFRKAYDLEGAHYGYCLGTTLSSWASSKKADRYCWSRLGFTSPTP